MAEAVTLVGCEPPELTIGLLGVKVPKEWGCNLDTARMGYMRDMRLEEVERRILAIEAAQGTNGDAPTPSSTGATP